MHEINTKFHTVQDISEAKRQAFQDWQRRAEAEREYWRLEAAFHATDDTNEKNRLGRLIAKQFDYLYGGKK